jgi:alpha-galactosidase
MDKTGIILIGAGSVKFTQGLLADLIKSSTPWKLGLVDTDPRALETAEALARRMVQAKQSDISVEASTDRCDLLPGAHVVVTTIGVGGRRAWEEDVFIPRKYGVYQPVGDTAMAGGVSRAMRMVPAMVDIARDVLKLCPQALFFNYANPMTVNCWSVRKATGAKIVGLCIGVHGIAENLARIIGVPSAEVTALAAGLNHFTWIYDLRWKGQDAWPMLRDRLRENPGVGGKFCEWLFHSYGAFPAVGDGHVMEFFPERFPDGNCFGRPLGREGNFEGIIERDDATYANMQAQARGEIPLDESVFQRASGEHTKLLEILRSIAEDGRGMYFANLPNLGAVPNLPNEAVLELTAVATSRGLRAIQIPDFPDTLAAPLIRKIAAASLTVDAALTGSRKLFVEALLADGSMNDPSTAEKLADELLMAHKQYLPQFA